MNIAEKEKLTKPLRIIMNKRIGSTTRFRAEGEKEYDDDSNDYAMERINTIRPALLSKDFPFSLEAFALFLRASKLYFTRYSN